MVLLTLEGANKGLPIPQMPWRGQLELQAIGVVGNLIKQRFRTVSETDHRLSRQGLQCSTHQEA